MQSGRRYSPPQDSRGYIWLGTEGGGVNRFDGVNFQAYTKKNGLAGNIVRSLMEDSRGNIWIGTDEGISIYDGLTFRTFGEAQGVPPGHIMCFLETASNTVWAGVAGGGMARMEIVNKDSMTVSVFNSYNDDLKSDIVFDMELDDRGRIWVAAYNGGINIVTDMGSTIEIEYITRSEGLPSNEILTLEVDQEGNLWGGTYDHGAFKMIMAGEDSGKVYTYNLINGINDNRVWNITADADGAVWFGTGDGGLNKYENGGFTTYTMKNGLANNQILCVMQDNDGIIWAGSMGSGLIKFNGYHFAHYGEKEGLSNDAVSDIVQDKFGNYWLSSWDGLSQMNFLHGEPVVLTYDLTDGLIDVKIMGLAVTQEGDIWMATEKGITLFTPPGLDPYEDENDRADIKPRSYSKDQGLIDNSVNCVMVDDENRLWCGTRGGVSFMLGNDAFVNIQEYDGLINNEVQTIIQSSDGLIWFGTLGGLAKTDMAIMTTYDEAEGLFEKKIHALAEDPKGNIWIGTFGGGLYKLDVHSEDTLPISFIVDDSLLSSNNVYSMIFLDDNTLLIGTDNGTDRLLLDGNQNILSVKNYGKSDGFIGVENNLNATYKDKKGNIWFGTVAGVTRYNPRVERMNKSAPRTHITGIEMFFETVDWSSYGDSLYPWLSLPKELVLPYSENHLTFSYTGISLTNPEKVLYKFKLDGLESDWSPPRTEVEAIYSGLTPGEYTFNVQAVNENGIWNDKPTTYHFVITPPFWQTWWFYMLCAFVTVVGVIAFVKWRERSLRREKTILEDKVRERTKELAEKNKEITDSINYAQNIQQAILPAIKSIERGFEDSFVLFRPRDIVSGDFYWYADKEDKAFIAACDCTGHGVPGAFVSMIGNNLLNQIILEKNIEEPGEILSKLNQGVKFAFTQDGEQEAQDGMDMVLAVLDRKKMELQFAGANNPMIYIKKGELEVKKADRTSIGGDTSMDFEFVNHTVKVEEGDQFYLFSDGYPDQFGGVKGKKFMMRQYKEMILENHKKPMSEQHDIYHKALLGWMGNEHEQIDD
ncbi:MAG: SpoIIE family protein phosphatase, partial [Flavobacteriales bacterium]|nr:SpoIIE family protein phosphatase [Flavobacteriales bacterium]